MKCEMISFPEFPCPECGHPTSWESECPGYRSEGKVMVCVPPCGGAQEFFCVCADCSWWYRYPNRRSTEGMGMRPEWLEQAIFRGEEDNEEDEE